MEIVLPKPLARPIYRETLAEFDGLDPWNGGCSTRWMLVIYQLTPAYRVEKFELSATNLEADLPMGHAVGLFCRQTNQHYLLPYSLRRLWQQGLLAMEVLPRALFRSEQAGVVDRELVAAGNHLRVVSAVGLSAGVTMSIAGVLLWLLFGFVEAAVFCAFLGLLIAGVFAALLLKYQLWKRRQARFAQHWLAMAQDG